MIRVFFRGLRQILGPFMLLWERLSRPTPISRSAADQARVDAMTRGLSLYQFKTCPFCIKVRRELARLALRVELRDAQHDARYRDELLRQGGEIKVPCLRIETADGAVTWLYESAAIIAFLRQLDA